MNKRFLIILSLAVLVLSVSGKAQNGMLLQASFDLYNGDAQLAMIRLQENRPPAEDIEAYYDLLAKAAWMVHDYDLAEEALQKKLLKTDQPGLIYLNLAKISFATGKTDQGYERLARYLEQEDRLSARQIQTDAAFQQMAETREWIRFWSGDWYSTQEDRLDEGRAEIDLDFPSEEMIVDLLEDYPDDHRALLIAAKYYHKIGNNHKAVDFFRQVLTLHPSEAVALQLAALYEQQGQKEKAITVIDNFLKVSPYHPEVWMKSVSLQTSVQSGQHLRYLRSLGIQNRQLVLSAVREDLKDQPTRALQQINSLLEDNPLDKTALNLRAQLWAGENRLEEAITDYTQSLDIDPFQGQVYFNRAEIRHQLGDQEGACHDWKKALQYGNRKAFNRLSQFCDF